VNASVALSAIGFAICVMGARLAARSVTPMAGALAFGALWAAWDFLAASSPNGALVSLASSQVALPIVVQSAALFGSWAITFLLGTVAALLALAFRERRAFYLLPAAALFMANLAVGAIHLERPLGPAQQVTLIDSDALSEASAIDRQDIALGAVLAYAAEIRLKALGSDLVVLPERIAVLRPEWRAAAISYLRQAAIGTGATIVAGFELHDAGGVHNIALRVPASGAVSEYAQGGDAGTIAISHDLNYFAAMRTRMVKAPASLLAVPAWDFGADATAESHKAVLRAVESGFALARNARDGELVLSDPFGRVIARKHSGGDGFTILTRDVPVGAAPGHTLYDRIGDSIVWLCAVLAASILLTGLLRILAAATPAGDLRRRRGTRGIPAVSWSGVAVRSAASSRHAAPRRH
jgi:apolipoprotein N-acyltransferase